MSSSIPTLMSSTLQPVVRTMQDSGGNVQTVKKWCFDRTPVYFSAEEPQPSAYLDKGTVVGLTEPPQNIAAASSGSPWSEIAYQVNDLQVGTQWVTGWVNNAYLDDYNEKFPNSGVVIPNPTPNPRDAQQYMLLDGTVRYNMCGELCVAFLVNDNIDAVLAKWKAKSPNAYNSVLAGGKDTGTFVSDMNNMLGALLGEYGFGSDPDQTVNFSDRLTIPVSAASLLEDLKKMLVTHSLVALVTINNSGELIGKENVRIKHWVVVDRLTQNGNRVELYNPFPNKREEYSFHEFYGSCRLPWLGAWVKRKEARSIDSAEEFPKFEVPIANPNPAYNAAQYLDIDGKKKTNLCGEFCTALIVKESINTVLEHWKEVQPLLYVDVVGNNKGTGTFDLKTILKSYGYNNEGDILDFGAGLIDPYVKKYLFSPGRLAKMLEAYLFIAGVNIDGITGRLKAGDDIRHWVVVDKIAPVGKQVGGNGGWVELYNPFLNRREEYSFREFAKSVGAQWNGLWVKRQIVPKFVPQVVVGPSGGGVVGPARNPQKSGRVGSWSEGQLRAVLSQQLKSGKSINKIAAELAERSGWKRQNILDTLKAMTKGNTLGKWPEAQLRGEIAKRQSLGKPVNKIVNQLAENPVGNGRKSLSWSRTRTGAVEDELLAEGICTLLFLCLS